MKKLCAIKDALRDYVSQDSFSIKHVYADAFKRTQKVSWRFVVWNGMSLPRHRFCIWLMALEKLKTKDKLFALGVINDDLCPLCAASAETVRHLFFECPFSRRCLDDLAAWVGFRFKPLMVMNFRKRRLNKKQQQAMCSIYANYVYAIWRSRNLAVWEQRVSHPSHTVRQIRNEIALRFQSSNYHSTI